MEEEKKERCFPFGKCNKKAIIDALTIGFVAGAAAAIGLIKLLGIFDEKNS